MLIPSHARKAKVSKVAKISIREIQARYALSMYQCKTPTTVDIQHESVQKRNLCKTVATVTSAAGSVRFGCLLCLCQSI